MRYFNVKEGRALSRTTRVKVSIVLKFLVVICVIVAFCLNLKGVPNLLLYFTGQSNFFIMWLDLVLAFLLIRSMKTGTYELDTIPYILQLMFTVAITITAIIFCAVLAPVFLLSGAPLSFILNPYQLLLHVIVPALAIIDFLAFTRPQNYSYKFRDFLFALIVPLYYLIFQIICFVSNVEFSPGQNYPYFFMNWKSPAGIWGFSSEMPYFMGGGYWIIIILAITLAISFLYLRTVNKHIVKNREKLI